MELHTVSVAACYTQADVTNFAKILTGWTIDYGADRPGFLFDADTHEPGKFSVMGRVFPPGEQGGVAALQRLAHHPGTYQFLATKLARHFIADDPPPESVARIEGVLADTGGDLGAAASALVDMPEAWRPLTKLCDPQGYVIAVVRALSLLRNEGGSVGTSLAQTMQERREQFHSLRLGESLDPFNAAVRSFLDQVSGPFLEQTGDPVAAQ